MLDFNLNGDILEVIQTYLSFTKTNKEYWYYNIKDWKKSITGQQNELPRHPMDHNQIQWVKDWYLPSIKQLTTA